MPMKAPIATALYPLGEEDFARDCRSRLDRSGALVLDGFFTAAFVKEVHSEAEQRMDEAYFTTDSHNVFLTDSNPGLGSDHPVNRQIVSTKGCLTDALVPPASPLRSVYESPAFKAFLCAVLDVECLHPYADAVSSINVHFHCDGQELGWHFDNSSFAVTMLVQEPESGGKFEYVPGLRDAVTGQSDPAGIGAVLDGKRSATGVSLVPGDLLLFRGRDALHRVTPSRGPRPRILVVFAYNTEPGISLSASAQRTFYGPES